MRRHNTIGMTLFHRYLLLLCLALALAPLGAVDHAQAQIDWLRSRGGFFSPKIHFDPPKGLFAIDDIAKGEMIMMIPRHCLLISKNICDGVKHVLHERQLGDKSEFAPYIDYLYSTPAGLVPSAWSDPGKKLLKDVWGQDLLPDSRDLTSLSYERHCEGSGDPEEEHAFMMVYSRCWDEICLPVFDMVNHRNGRWNNMDTNSVHRGKDGFFVFASRDVAAGEPLHFSYNWCTDCEHFGNNAVTPHILRDYGFVEQYPRRWPFRDPWTGHNVYFDLDLDASNELKLSWLFNKKPDEDHLQIIKEHLERLGNMRQDVQQRAEKLESQHEREVTLEFYDAFVEALEYAIANTNLETVGKEDCKVV